MVQQHRFQLSKPPEPWRSCKRARDIAALALEARTKGKVTTRAVIARYEEIVELDAGVHWDWVELRGRLERLGE